MKRIFQLLSVIPVMILSFGLAAQTMITGKVTDSATGEGLIGASVQVVGTTAGTTTDLNGSYTLNVPDGANVLEVTYTGYKSAQISIDGKTTIDVTLEIGIALDEVIVSASRRPEKIINSPSSISVIGAKRINNTAVANPLQLMKNTAGVSISEQGAGRMSINLRGQVGTFFSGIYVARDYKPLTHPGNGSFFANDHSLSPLDIERVEVVRGPGSALYGPGVTNGVVHFISKSPFKHAGTSAELGLNTVNGFDGFGYSTTVRHAGHNEKGTVGYKINAYYKETDEWAYDIYNDPDLANTAGRLRGVDVIQSVESGEALITGILADGLQDYFRNYNIDGALYFKKPSSNDNLVLAGGYTKTDHVWMTTNNIAIRRPNAFFAQARGTLGNTFANISFTSNKTGDEESNLAAFYRATNRDADGVRNIALTQAEQYEFLEAQLQHRLLFKGLNNTELLVGGELRLLDIDGGVFGRNTGDTPYDLYGGYLQSKTPLADKLDMTLALRYDYYSVLEENSIAPRVAFVYKPNESGSFRLSYNQAYTSPAGLNFYLDLNLGPNTDDMRNFISWTRLVGSATEIHTYNSPMVDWGGTANALPISGLSLSHADAIEAAAAAGGINVDVSGVSGTSDLNNNIVAGNNNPASLVNAAPLKLQKNQTYEIGYSGQIGKKLNVTIDLYYNDIENASAVNTDYGRFISNAGLADAVKGSAASLGLSGTDLDNLNAAIDGLFAGNKVGAILSDIQLSDEVTAAGNAGAPYTFRQYFSAAAIDYVGYDVQIGYEINENWDIQLNYSGLSETEFTDDTGLRYLLNTPQNRLRGSLGYSADQFSALLDFQWQEEFEILNGTFSGIVDTRTTVDLSLGYKFNNNLGLVVTGSNIFNNEYQAFPGSFKIGNQFVAKVRYEF